MLQGQLPWQFHGINSISLLLLWLMRWHLPKLQNLMQQLWISTCKSTTRASCLPSTTPSCFCCSPVSRAKLCILVSKVQQAHILPMRLVSVGGLGTRSFWNSSFYISLFLAKYLISGMHLRFGPVDHWKDQHCLLLRSAAGAWYLDHVCKLDLFFPHRKGFSQEFYLLL